MSENYYQIILLGKVDERLVSIQKSLTNRFNDLKINPNFIKFIHSENYSSKDPKLMWFR